MPYTKHKLLAMVLLSLALVCFMWPKFAYAKPADVGGGGSTSQPVASDTKVKNGLKNNPLIKDIQTIVNVLSAGVGIVVTGVIIFSGIQYAFVGDNSQKISAAKHRILNAVLALIAFMFLYAFIQWLIPGGFFDK